MASARDGLTGVKAHSTSFSIARQNSFHPDQDSIRLCHKDRLCERLQDYTAPGGASFRWCR